MSFAIDFRSTFEMPSIPKLVLFFNLLIIFKVSFSETDEKEKREWAEFAR